MHKYIYARKGYRQSTFLDTKTRIDLKRKMVNVTFTPKGRFGNALFQYLFCKLITIHFGHEYISTNEMSIDDCLIIKEDDIDVHTIFSDKNDNLSTKNIICDGYFQKSDLFINDRNKLIEIVYNNNNDYWEYNNEKIYVKDYLNGNHSISLNPRDIVISLRLDDFIQYPCKTSDIIPPQYYIEILNNMKIENEKVYILCDRIKYDWEHRYIEYFKKWNPILIQNTLIHDIALMRDSNILLHSNSTLCWIISFLSQKTKRIIPKTDFYINQSLNRIEISDTLIDVRPLDHDEVHNLNVNDNQIIPLPFSIPDECVVESIPSKECLLASLIPGNIATYIFGKHDENAYYEMYKKSRFALTKMKGGWDCLRHYEILMNGCIPLFENLKDCPSNTMITYPKHLNDEAYDLFNNWSENEENIYKYNILCEKFLEHTRKFCTTSYVAKHFLNNIKNGDKIKNILLITGHSGVNYTREFTWIGLKRYIQSIGGVAVEYPKIEILYNDYDIHSSQNITYTYPKRLSNDYNMQETEIIDKITSNFWDLIIYGKVGPDEFCDFPLYQIVKSKYNKNKIAFIFGGDEIFNLKVVDKYSYHINMFNRHIPYWPYVEYLNYYKQFGTCFVRELDM